MQARGTSHLDPRASSSTRCRSRAPRLSVLDDPDFSPHPGVDAALVLFDADLVFGFVGRVAGMKELHRLRIAFRDRGPKSTRIVDRLNEAATELIDFGKRVRLATVIERRQNVADLQHDVAGGHVPRADRVVTRQLVEEVRKLNASRSYTGARSGSGGWRGVEGIWIAGIHECHRFSLIRLHCELRR